MRYLSIIITISVIIISTSCHTTQELVEKSVQVEQTPDLTALGDSAYFYGKIAGKTVFLTEGNFLHELVQGTYAGYPPLMQDSSIVSGAYIRKRDTKKEPLDIGFLLYRPLRSPKNFTLFQEELKIGRKTTTQEKPFSYPNFTISIIYMDNGKYRHGFLYPYKGKSAEIEILATQSFLSTTSRFSPEVMVKFRLKGSIWSSNDPQKETPEYLGEIEGVSQVHFRYEYVNIDEMLKKFSGK